MYTPYNPLLNSKIGVYRDDFFLTIALKQRLWVLDDLSKNKKNITLIHLKIIIFTVLKNHSVLHGHVFVMTYKNRHHDATMILIYLFLSLFRA